MRTATAASPAFASASSPVAARRTGERDRAAVYGSAADPALGRDVDRIDPVPAAISHD